MCLDPLHCPTPLRSNVYRVTPAGVTTCVSTGLGLVRPNGLAFSLDYSWLYVGDTGATHLPDGPRHIRKFQVGPEGELKDFGAVFCTLKPEEGLYDGFRLDGAANSLVP